MFERVKIEDPRDCTYPFTSALYDDPQVIYHGTSSNYASLIECRGFMAGNVPLPLMDLESLVSVCERIGFRPWSYTTIKGLADGGKLTHGMNRHVYFSANFWYARDYARSIGGETVHNAILLTEELLSHLGSGHHQEGRLIEKVQEIRQRLLADTLGSFPVVYAVRVEPEWLGHPSDLDRDEHMKGFLTAAVNISCATAIPFDRLVGKVEYFNGAEGGYLSLRPAAWEEARLWGR
jgi:hypothetical protein